MTDASKPPCRAHCITLSSGADTRDGLAQELRFMANRLERGELTRGAIGGPTAGSSYEYTVDEAMTHDRYFEAVKAWQEAREA